MGVYYFKFHRNKPIKKKDIAQNQLTLFKYEQRQLFAKKISKNKSKCTHKKPQNRHKQS